MSAEDRGHFWQEPTEGDKFLAASENLLAAKEKEERNLLLELTGHSVEFFLRKPRDFLRSASPQPFELHEVPEPISQLAHAFSTATGFDQSGIIVAATVAAASVIDERYRLAVRAESNWYESARLWAVLIGTPSAGKSPTIRAATGHIKVMHDAQVAQWREQSAGVDEPSPMPALYTSNATIAALSEKLKGNPRGLLMLTEEFSSWIGGIDSANRGEAASNRGDWLQLYDGGSHQIDRVQRGSFLVPNWGASVLAACTPDGLRQHLKQLPDDGLIHRFIPVIMSAPNFDAKGDARAAIEFWARWLSWAYDNTERPQPQVAVQFSPEAAQLFEQEHREQRILTDATYDFAPALASHLGKHGGMLARVALVFHVFSGTQGDAISTETMWRAILFMRRVRKHAAAMFDGILSTSPALDLARALGRSLVADGSLIATVGRDWMGQHCRAFKKADEQLRREAVQLLEDADWLEAQPGARSYGGWPTRWTVHERLSDMFAREGEQWRARRAAVREAIGTDDPE